MQSPSGSPTDSPEELLHLPIVETPPQAQQIIASVWTRPENGVVRAKSIEGPNKVARCELRRIGSDHH